MDPCARVSEAFPKAPRSRDFMRRLSWRLSKPFLIQRRKLVSVGDDIFFALGDSDIRDFVSSRT